MNSPEVANSIQTGIFETNYRDVGSGDPLFLIHGSGPVLLPGPIGGWLYRL